MSFIYRMATPADRNAYIDFINYVFSQAHQPHDFKALIPKVYGDGRESRAEHFIATDEAGNIRGCVACLPYEVNILGRELKIGFIGSVSSHPYGRGEGHMKKLMPMAEQWMIENGIDIGLLGGNRQRYEYFGYGKGGVRFIYTYDGNNVRHALRDVDCSDISICEITDENDARLDSIYQLFNAQPAHAVRERERFHVIAQTWNCKLYAVMRGEACTGYIIANGSGDIAEWQMADPADHPKALKKWFQNCCARHIQISCQPTDTDWIDFLDETAAGMEICEDENQRIFNWPKALEALLALKQQLCGISDGVCCVKVDGEPLCIRVENGQISISRENCENAQEVTAMQLQNAMLRPIAYHRKRNIGGAPTDWFPLPLFYSTPDGF